jgi:hypothetical protein
MIDGKKQSIGPVETSILEIELAELRIEHANLIARHSGSADDSIRL